MRPSVLIPAAVLALGAVVLAAPALGPSDAKESADRNAPAPPPMKGLKIHEWGVFRMNGAKFVASGGGEAPTFLQKVKLPPAPPPQVRQGKGAGVAADLPILHVYAPSPVRLKVKVCFPGGSPTLAWPPAEPGWSSCQEAAPCVDWDVWVQDDSINTPAIPPKVPGEHWISVLRKVGSDLLIGADARRESEHFLFYEGEVDYKGDVKATMIPGGLALPHLALSSDSVAEAWSIEADAKGSILAVRTALAGGKEVHALVDGLLQTEPKDLQAQLSKALEAAGLTVDEAMALLTIWMPSLTAPGQRLVYLMPRASYDAILPITFDPAPEELVRVGLVVRELP